MYIHVYTYKLCVYAAYFDINIKGCFVPQDGNSALLKACQGGFVNIARKLCGRHTDTTARADVNHANSVRKYTFRILCIRLLTYICTYVHTYMYM